MSELVLAGLTGLLAFVGSWSAIKIQLTYMQRDINRNTHSVRAAHWRLDQVKAPAAPLEQDRN